MKVTTQAPMEQFPRFEVRCLAELGVVEVEFSAGILAEAIVNDVRTFRRAVVRSLVGLIRQGNDSTYAKRRVPNGMASFSVARVDADRPYAFGLSFAANWMGLARLRYDLAGIIRSLRELCRRVLMQKAV